VIAQVLAFLSTLAVPVTLWCVVDDWFLRPRRAIAAAPQRPETPAVTQVAYLVLPVLIGAAVIRLLMAERLDFSLVLTLVAAISGLVWALDAAVLLPARRRLAAASGKDIAQIREPGTVDYARSFFPVALAVLLLRSFVFEPFRIPSDSMMPTLLDGDFIVVNKYAYGLRLPVTNQRFVEVGSPQRGDIAVFRYPPDPAVNYIKRIVGLPGDRVSVQDDRLVVNGEPVPFEEIGRFTDGCYLNMGLARERIGERAHEVLFCRTPGDLVGPPLASCDRRIGRSYRCEEGAFPGLPDRGDTAEMIVPPGHYLGIGDNRDNSADGRYFGFVPEQNLVGKATRIWFNWDFQRAGGPKWSRIGQRID
jgi:signal peptidase I